MSSYINPALPVRKSAAAAAPCAFVARRREQRLEYRRRAKFQPESPIGPGVAIRENVSGAVVGDRVKNISVKR